MSPAERAFHDLDDVSVGLLHRIAVMQRLGHLLGDVLVQRAAADDVQRLHAAADGHDRQPHVDGQLRQAAVELFTANGHRPRMRVRRHAHLHRVEILRAARKHQAVAELQRLLEVGVI